MMVVTPTDKLINLGNVYSLGSLNKYPVITVSSAYFKILQEGFVLIHLLVYNEKRTGDKTQP